MPKFSRRQALSAGAAAAILPWLARPPSATALADIRKAGVLKAGCQVAQVPWGYTDDKATLTGFDIEFVRLFAADLGVRAEIAPVTSSNRVAALLTGQVDMLAAVMGIFADRQKVVLFARPYCVNDTVFIGKVG